MLEPHLMKLVAALGREAVARGDVIVTAESLTAGAISSAITEVAGSSSWFERGFVTYLPIAKEEMLGVRKMTIATFGVVSEETACEMADGALTHSYGTVAVAVTGIAGPGGAEPGKPVGTVCFGFARKGKAVLTETCHFAGDRQAVRRATVEHALQGLLHLVQYPR